MTENEISPEMSELIAERTAKKTGKPGAGEINNNVSPEMKEYIKDRDTKHIKKIKRNVC